jgi:hypothetical protein
VARRVRCAAVRRAGGTCYRIPMARRHDGFRRVSTPGHGEWNPRAGRPTASPVDALHEQCTPRTAPPDHEYYDRRDQADWARRWPVEGPVGGPPKGHYTLNDEGGCRACWPVLPRPGGPPGAGSSARTASKTGALRRRAAVCGSAAVCRPSRNVGRVPMSHRVRPPIPIAVDHATVRGDVLPRSVVPRARTQTQHLSGRSDVPSAVPAAARCGPQDSRNSSAKGPSRLGMSPVQKDHGTAARPGASCRHPRSPIADVPGSGSCCSREHRHECRAAAGRPLWTHRLVNGACPRVARAARSRASRTIPA